MSCSKLEARGHLLHKTGLWQWYTGISVSFSSLKTRYKFFEKNSQLLKISRYPSWKFYNWVLYPSHSIYTSGGLWAPAMLLKNSPFTHFWCNNLAQFKVQFLVETVKQHAASSPWNHKDDLICLEFSWNSQNYF